MITTDQIEEVKMSFKPLAEALAEFRETLVQGGFEPEQGFRLTEALVYLLEKQPQMLAFDTHKHLIDQRWDVYMRGLATKNNPHLPPTYTAPNPCNCGGDPSCAHCMGRR